MFWDITKFGLNNGILTTRKKKKVLSAEQITYLEVG